MAGERRRPTMAWGIRKFASLARGGLFLAVCFFTWRFQDPLIWDSCPGRFVLDFPFVGDWHQGASLRRVSTGCTAKFGY
ncbi:hypothetical protein EJ05DRAFT_124897 [Pseudovirgaria hyperparasitica]|uniref:Uncharacterized protein n=1 Tax=Pseudovirgaria hyperparasitica TaxID=470096 RepID=A0A6A6VY45_9PEZI|nr:uncharacterized protein EJ05DRAFT_124897 [Pseudovirgaria hyperparasitica]KAF2755173.1 hypothetical protein EJ05DRAFT_124897 [Pseudovirgaria hyperparasitica]